MVAFLGVFLSHQLNTPVPDGIASIIIGLILAAVAFLLAFESKSLLLGETADPKIVAGIKQLVLEYSAVERVRRPMTMHFGPQEILLNLDVQFKSDLSAAELVKVIDDLEQRIRQSYPRIQRIFIEVEGLKGYEKPEGI